MKQLDILVPVLVLVGVAAILYAGMAPRPGAPAPAEEVTEPAEPPVTE